MMGPSGSSGVLMEQHHPARRGQAVKVKVETEVDTGRIVVWMCP